MQNRQIIVCRDIELPARFPIRIERHTLYGESERPPIVPEIHAYLEIGLCLKGQGLFSVDAKIMPFRPGDILIVPPNIPHWGRGSRGMRSTWDWIFVRHLRVLGGRCSDPALIDLDWMDTPDFCNVVAGDGHPRIRSAMQELIEEVAGNGARREAAIEGALTLLFARLHRLPRSGDTPPVRQVSRDQLHRILPALKWIQQHYDRKCNMPDLARTCHMSLSSFRQHFRKVMGCAPHRYLTRYRISMACLDLSLGTQNVEEIATQHGFPTLSCFVRQFSAQMGVPPRTWARKK